MKIAELGEFGLIERFIKKIRLDHSVIKGAGDDCAVIDYTKDKFALFSSDMIVEGVDFTRNDSFELIGRKALGISLSDIAACGGQPCHALICLGFPKNTDIKIFDKVTNGLLKLAREFGVNIVGGDMSASEKIILNSSVIGYVDKNSLALRSGARLGDIIFVSGFLGGSIRGKHLSFVPRVREAQYLVRRYKIHSMIDISDGLLQDLGHILSSSNSGAKLYSGLIPIAKDARSLDEALYMGEDFELLFTASSGQAKKIVRDRRFKFFPIGEIVNRSCGIKLFDKRGRQMPIAGSGFRHF